MGQFSMQIMGLSGSVLDAIQQLALQMGEGYQQAYQAVADYDFAKALAALTCPLMICAGTEDPLYGLMDAVVAIKPDTIKAEIAGGKTYVCERNTAAIAELMHNFFSAN